MTAETIARPDWIKCVSLGDDGRTWCGRNEKPFFVDVTHAALNGAQGGRLVACPECVEVIIAALTNAALTGAEGVRVDANVRQQGETK